MSALRLGRLPDGTREVRILEPAVGRITHTRGAIHEWPPTYPQRVSRNVDDSVMKNPDNGAVRASITEVQR